MIRKLLFALSIFLCINGYAQKIAVLEVELPVAANGIDIPVSVELDNITFEPASSLSLVEVKGAGRTPVTYQVEEGEQRLLHWLVKADGNQSKKRVYELVKGQPPNATELKAGMDDGMLTIHKGNQNLLRYYYKTLEAPEGKNPAYRRSAFIHPLWTPHGQELTRIQPPDHAHHYGIWNPWTHALFEKDTIDFWNIGDKKGTVRFANFTAVTDGAVYAQYDAVHEHVVFKKDGSEKVAMNELQSVRVYNPGDSRDFFIVDMTMQMNCATSSPLLLLEYRYGGLGWRTTQEWDRNNSEVITSEGKTRKDADGSKATWCIVQGKLGDDYGGALMMSYPTNYNHPEPLRIWPENMYNRGDMFANFDPTKDKDWLLEPGKKYVLKYRWIVFNGHFTKEKAAGAWKYFAMPPKVTVKKN